MQRVVQLTVKGLTNMFTVERDGFVEFCAVERPGRLPYPSRCMVKREAARIKPPHQRFLNTAFGYSKKELQDRSEYRQGTRARKKARGKK